MPTAEDLASLAAGDDVRLWREAVDAAFALDVADRELALTALRRVYESRLVPSFHIVPWGPSLYERADFRAIYADAKRLTDGFREVEADDLLRALEENPRTLLVFRAILGYTLDELCSALELVDVRTTKGTLGVLERSAEPPTAAQRKLLAGAATAITQVLRRELFPIDDALPTEDFRSRLDKLDTEDGWAGVQWLADRGVDYGDLLYERYLNGPWLTARSAYSEKTGRQLEDALSNLFIEAGVIFTQNPEDLVRAGVLPSKPDFVLSDRERPRVALEAKAANDGGTARDKAARIVNVAVDAERAGMITLAVIDGKGFKRRDALVQTLQATHGLTFSLSNIHLILDVPEVSALRGLAA